MEFKDYYKIMGVARDVSQDDLKKAHRALARKFHPDVSKEKDAEARFKEVGEAYEVLSDPAKRAAYDQFGSDYKAGQEFRPPPQWDAGYEFAGGEFAGGGFAGGGAETYSDFFEALFGRGFGGGPGRRESSSERDAHGADRHAKIAIDAETSFRGATESITLKASQLDASGRPTLSEHKLNVKIPRGIVPGQHIRLAGQGAPGIGKGSPGDLYLEIEFRPHALYRFEGRDVYLDLPIAPWEAALGATIGAPTPGGKVELKVPIGSASGSKLRLKGQGIPAKEPGDFYAVLRVVLPTADDEAAKKVYEDMAAQFPNFNPRARLGSSV